MGLVDDYIRLDEPLLAPKSGAEVAAGQHSEDFNPQHTNDEGTLHTLYLSLGGNKRTHGSNHR